MSSFVRKSLLACIFLSLVLIPSIGGAALKVVAEPGTEPAHLAMAQKTVDSFNSVLLVEMGAVLDKDVTIYICPTRESYRQVLQRNLRQSAAEAERLAKVTGGFSNRQADAVAVHFELSSGVTAEKRAYTTVAHELFHQLQSQLAKANMSKSFYWLKEGTADYIGAAVAEKLGYQSMEKWKLDQVNALRKAETHVSPQAILTTTLDQWTTLMEQKQYPYEMSDLMVFYLVKQVGSNGYPAIAEYYRLLGQGVETEQAFERAFKITSTNMLAGFQAWFFDISSQPAVIEIIAGTGVAEGWVDDFRRGAEIARSFFIESWGRDIKNSMRFVLTVGKPDYAAAIVREFGVSPAEAEERAKSSTWWYAGSTTVYDMGSLTNKQQRVFSIAGSLVRRVEQETAPQKSLEQLYWLVSGSTDAVAALLVERSGASTVAQYKSSWLASVGKAATLPKLSELSTLQSWNQAKEKYGVAAVNRTASLAGLYLTDKYGTGSVINWCKAVKDTGNAETAFQQIFGMTTAQFSDEFADYLRKNSKNAS